MRRLLAAFLLFLFAAPVAESCTVTGMTASGPTTFTVTPNYTGSAITYNFTLVFTALISGTGTCSLGASFRGTASSPQMTNSGGNRLSYTLPTYYTTTPGTKATGTYNNTANATSVQITYAATVTIAADQTALSGTPNGGYQDISVSLVLFQTSVSNTVVGTLPLTFVETVANPTTCTIGGAANGGTQTLDFSNGGTISIAAKIASFGTLTCNDPATLQLTSSNGAAKASAAAAGRFTNFFDYIATTTVNGGTVTLNTSTVSTALGAESATGRISALTTTGAALSISVTPITPSQPLVAGSYLDVLTLTITPD